MPNSEIRILFLEDSPVDAELSEKILRKSDIIFQSDRVETRDSFTESLESFKPDLILADFKLQGFTGREALKIVNEKTSDIPFIVVTGAIGEELAVDLIKDGATDYVFKDRLARLPTAVLHALEETRLKRERKIAEDRFKIIFEHALDGIVLINESGLIVDCNPEFERQAGRTLNDLKILHIWEIRSPEKVELAKKKFFEVLEKGEGGSIDLNLLQPDGNLVFIEVLSSRIEMGGKKYVQSISRDMTIRNIEQAKLVQSEANLKEAQKIARLGSWTLEIEKNHLSWSDEIFSIFEIDKNKFGATYEAFLDSIHPDDRDAVNSAYSDSLKTRQPYEIIHRLLMPDGRIKYVHEICKTTYNGNNNPLVSTGTVQDITIQYEAEEQIRNLNRTLRTISACNETLVRAKSEEILLKEICQNIINIGGHKLAWIGFPDTSGAIIQPVAFGGDEKLLEAHTNLSKTPEHDEKCVTAASWKAHKTVVQNKLIETPVYSTDKRLQELGINSILALPLLSQSNAYGVLTILSENPEAFNQNEIKLMEELVADIAYGITALRTARERDKYLHRFGAAMKNTVVAIARTLEMRDPYTAGHQVRVANLARAIAMEMGVTEEKAQGVHLAGIIHDIGKIQIPAEILSKPGKLTELDFNFIKTHPQAGYDILKDIEFPWPIAQMVLQHHEKLDGSGYPNRLMWSEILPEAHILHVADVVEAMSSHRPYRPSLGIDAALNEIVQYNGIHFDPKVVQACLVLFREKSYTFEETV
jgi:PAS domain S-box-containing protein/putative nucleotidyltransferase with HDIG domain